MDPNASMENVIDVPVDLSHPTVESPHRNQTSNPRIVSWYLSLMGRERGMKEALIIPHQLFAGKYEFFAAYDGHGGDKVLNACRDRLHHIVEEELEKNGREGRNDWKETMEACYSKMDDEVEFHIDDYENEEDINIEDEEVGSTALVVVMDGEDLVVANCGDSRAVFCRGGDTIPLSFDHTPTRIDEKQRVEAAGGRILNWNGARVQGILHVTRAIGDHYLRPLVISTPEVTVTKRSDADEFLIIATRSLWDVVPSETAINLVSSFFSDCESRINNETPDTDPAAILVAYAMAKGIQDNISVIVIDLHK